MNQFLVQETTISADEEQFTLRYLLTRNENAPGYGARIEKHTASGLSESAALDRIFSNFPQANRFLLLLAKNTVTPISLHNIAEDYF